MKYLFGSVCILFLSYVFTGCSIPETKTEIKASGLLEPVEVIRDTIGVNHIYAKNEHDLFFAQGYCAAQDRLFQFEIWRRQATGTLAEILGPREVIRDQASRLFRFRGDLKKEFAQYHPRGENIITAFTEGINAYILETEKNPKKLPPEFGLLGIKPGLWTPEVVISRHQGLLGNMTDETATGRAVSILGADKVNELRAFEPGKPDLNLDPKIKKELLTDSISELYNAFRRVVRFQPQDLIASANKNAEEYRRLSKQDDADDENIMLNEKQNVGSNNWIVSGSRSASGSPLLANDPHRAITSPSIRYMVHLNAPGWNVVGAGEPTVPGVSIGHNDEGAWGLTVFAIDVEDLYVYELNPANSNQYKYMGKWEDMRIEKDTIHVKGSADVYVENKFTRHGPVQRTDLKNNVAYALRAAWLQPGGAPYMASLRINQAKNWEEFREGCTYSAVPGENMIWADKLGNIGWQAVGIAPVRKNWSGLVPVPGDGRYEWDGYLPIQDLPHDYNPEKGFLATANENNIPAGYDHRNAVAWVWGDRFRVDRINEVLSAGDKFTVKNMTDLQTDYLSLPARTLVPFLKGLKSNDAEVESARKKLLPWDFIQNKNSVEAGIYVAWEKKITAGIAALAIPPEGKKYVKTITLVKVIQWVTSPGPLFGKNPEAGRNEFLINALSAAVAELQKNLGTDQSKWKLGQDAYHHVLIKHPMSNALDESARKKFEVGPLPRGGSASTPGVTSNNLNQNHGASFRMVVDVKDWDRAMFANTPGQSGNPESPFYSNLFALWANDKHFPVYFSREMVEKSAKEKVVMTAETESSSK